MDQNQLLGLMALNDTFGALGGIGSGRMPRPTALPLAFQMQAQNAAQQREVERQEAMLKTLAPSLFGQPSQQPAPSAAPMAGPGGFAGPVQQQPMSAPREWGFDTANVDPASLNALGGLFDAFGRNLPVTSAYRSAEHNERVGGAKHSQHLHGKAFDIDVSGLNQQEREQLIRTARERGFGGVGIYDNALHFDTGDVRAWGPSYSSDTVPAWASGALSATPTAAPQQPAQAAPQAQGGYPPEVLDIARARIQGGDRAGAIEVLTDWKMNALKNPADPWSGFKVAGGDVVGIGPDGPYVALETGGDRERAKDATGRLRWVDTGELVFPDVEAPGPDWSQMTPEEVAQNPGLSPDKLYLRNGKTGDIKAVGGGGQTINVNNAPGDKKWDEVSASKTAEMLTGLTEGGVNARGELAQIAELESLLADGLGGTADAWKVWAQNSLGVNIGAGGPAEAFSALISRLVPTQRPPGSGQMSDKDVELFKNSLPQLINSPEGNALILETMRGMAEFKRQQGEIAMQAMIGRIDRTEAIEQLYALPDPLERFRQMRVGNDDRRKRLQELQGGQ